MTLEEMFDGTIAEMQKYGEGTTLGELIRIKIREGEQWAANCWAKDQEYRGAPSYWSSQPGGPYLRWHSLVYLAAQRHPDWIVHEGREGPKAYGPRKSATTRTRLALVAWFVLNHTDLAFALEDESWNTIDA